MKYSSLRVERKGFMKTVEEFYREIAESKELQEELKAASDEMMKAFLKKHGCEASVKDFAAFVRSQDEGEIEDNDVEAIVGGVYYRPKTPISVHSVF